jgi:LytS/YehU family sensor histidine kinase
LIAVLHLFVLIACHAVAWALDRAEAARVAEARARAMERAAEEARAAALRLQLNPHFLFNTLNGITALVVTRRNDDAERMIGELADFLRASLTSEPTARVTLAAELRTVQAYLGIEQARLGSGSRSRLAPIPGPRWRWCPISSCSRWWRTP